MNTEELAKMINIIPFTLKDLVTTILIILVNSSIVANIEELAKIIILVINIKEDLTSDNILVILEDLITLETLVYIVKPALPTLVNI